MSTIVRLFVKQDLKLNSKIELEKSDAYYLSVVMRKKVNDKLYLVNGKDGEFLGEIAEIRKNKCVVKIEKQTREFDSSTSLGLIFAPIKKMDFILKAATELGVTDFCPVIMQNSFVRVFKEDKAYASIKEAVEQSERLDFPKINGIVKLAKVFGSLPENAVVLFCEERCSNQNILDHPRAKLEDDKVKYVLVGPEGGFTEGEKIFLRKQKNVYSVSLGKNILRTETSIVVAMSRVADW